MPKGHGGVLPRPRLVIIHDTSNTANAAQEAHYASTRTDAQADWTSCHFYVDASEVLGSCPLDIVAWAAPPCNSESWSVEMCGTNVTLSDGSPNSGIILARTANLVARLCAEGGIPVRHLTPQQIALGYSGIVGHADVNAVYHKSSHTDPGLSFNWIVFVSAVQAAQLDTTSHPVLRTGSTGPYVRELQVLLNMRGAGLAVDGQFGPLTHAAVTHYQQAVHISVDGVVGPQTWGKLLGP
jgi:N-acetyl-anhydromuramyl-L-alanine amidase AmpD